MVWKIISSIVLAVFVAGGLGYYWIQAANAIPDGFVTVMMSGVIVLAMLIYGAISFIAAGKSHANRVFLMVFFALLFLPMVRISRADKSLGENRMLAAPARLFVNGEMNNKFGIDFDAWFGDRFFLRDTLVRMHAILYKTAGNLVNQQVVSGRDDWLFFMPAIPDFNHTNMLNDKQLAKIAAYLQSWHDWCRRHNKRFVFYIAPNKESIYGENIMQVRGPRPNSISRAEQLTQYLRENTDVDVVMPHDFLRANKDRGLLYFKNDTHWNGLGAWYGYLYMMEKLNIRPIKTTGFESVSYPDGDLTKMLGGNGRQDTDTHYTVPQIAQTAHCDGSLESPDAGIVHCTNRNGRGGAFVLRDSFNVAMGPYIADTFGQSYFAWRYEPDANDIRIMSKPEIDTVMLIIVERSVGMLQKDPTSQE